MQATLAAAGGRREEDQCAGIHHEAGHLMRPNIYQLRQAQPVGAANPHVLPDGPVALAERGAAHSEAQRTLQANRWSGQADAN